MNWVYYATKRIGAFFQFTINFLGWEFKLQGNSETKPLEAVAELTYFTVIKFEFNQLSLSLSLSLPNIPTCLLAKVTPQITPFSLSPSRYYIIIRAKGTLTEKLKREKKQQQIWQANRLCFPWQNLNISVIMASTLNSITSRYYYIRSMWFGLWINLSNAYGDRGSWQNGLSGHVKHSSRFGVYRDFLL